MKYLSVLFLIFSCSSQSVETWYCTSGKSEDVLVKLESNHAVGKGLVELVGVRSYKAGYEVVGLERNWTFGGVNENGDDSDFLVIVQPHGVAEYHSFEDDSIQNPLFTMQCTLTVI